MNKEQILAIIQSGHTTDGDLADALLAELAKEQEPVAYRWRTYHKQGGYTERLCTDKVECEELNSQYMEEGEVVPLFTQPLPQPDLVAEIEAAYEAGYSAGYDACLEEQEE